MCNVHTHAGLAGAMRQANYVAYILAAQQDSGEKLLCRLQRSALSMPEDSKRGRIPCNHGSSDRAVSIDVGLIVSPGEHIAIAYERQVRHLPSTLCHILPVSCS